MKSFWKWFRWILLLLIVAGLVAVSLMPKPLPVDVATVEQGEMIVAVESEGVTRVRDLYTVAAPISGRLKRIELEEGELLREGSVAATILPAPIGPAERTELEARIGSIEATEQSAQANVSALTAQLAQARSERDRLKSLLDEGAVPRRDYEQAELAVKNLEDQVEGARSSARSTAQQVEAAKAGRAYYGEGGGSAVTVKAPATGSVLRVVEKSERVVMAGTPLLVLGDPKGLEILVDVLSTDAVSIEPGARIIIDGWGGDKSLDGIVRYIEPSAFTKISALGIEEQRVNIVGLFSEYPDKLGNGYRVIARIVTWQGANVLQVPSSALFRDGENWAAFVVEENIARKRVVKIGHRNSFQVEILEGLKAGEQVILHPSNQIQDGVQVE